VIDNEAWIFGKGPGLDCEPLVALAGKRRICINEATFAVPGCTEAVAADAVACEKILHDAFPELPVYTRKGVLDDDPARNLLHVDCPPSSPALAVLVARMMGFTTHNFIGFESLRGDYSYAKCMQEIGAAPKVPAKFRGPTGHLFRQLGLCRIRAVFHFADTYKGGE